MAIKDFNANMPDKSLCLQGKNILVSGLESHITVQEITIALAAEGANIILADRYLELCRELGKKIKALHNIKPTYLKLDLNNYNEAYYQKIAKTIRKHKINHLDGLIILNNKPGISTKAPNLSMGLWRNVMQTNLDGALALTNALMPLLFSAPRATLMYLVNNKITADSASNLPYDVSAYALSGLVNALALELKGSHLSVCGLNFAQHLWDAELTAAAKCAQSIVEVMAASDDKFNNKIF